MTTMTTEAADTTGPDDSWSTGYTDGELAAITGLSSRRVHARAAMADQHDPMYAQGLIDGYLHAAAVNYARKRADQFNDRIATEDDPGRRVAWRTIRDRETP